MSNHTCSDRPLPICKTSIVVIATIFTLFKANIQGGATFGRATSFVVSFALALNRMNIVAITTILVLHIAVIGHVAVPPNINPIIQLLFRPEGGSNFI